MTDAPSPFLLRQLLHYDPESGKLFWRARPRSMFANKQSHLAWHTRFANREALAAKQSSGYLCGTFRKKRFLAHRVIWAMQTGQWPVTQIDHIDGDRSNNAWGNLRAASHMENCYNRGLNKNNTSGFKGVSFDAKSKQWRADIGVGGRRVRLGLFATAELAHAAYVSSAQSMHGNFVRQS